MEITTLRLEADLGERFEPDAYAATIGKPVPVFNGDHRYRMGIVRNATVTDDGTAVVLEIEIPDGEDWITPPQ